jgi:hypothetical protein
VIAIHFVDDSTHGPTPTLIRHFWSIVSTREAFLSTAQTYNAADVVSIYIIISAGWSSFDVGTGFWGLWDNFINVAMVMLLKEVFNFHSMLCGNSGLKQKTIHPSMACYVDVLLHNTAK